MLPAGALPVIFASDHKVALFLELHRSVVVVFINLGKYEFADFGNIAALG